MKSIGLIHDSRSSRVLVLIAACAIFVALLGRRDIVTSHEARVAQVARVMADSGWPWSARLVSVPISGLVVRGQEKSLEPLPHEGRRDVNPWLVPVINDQIRLQKPPLPYWCTAIVFKVIGVSEFAARLVPALLGALATLLIADLARAILGRRAAIIAALVWITTQFVVDEYRKSMADPYLAFCALLAVWSFVRGRGVMMWIALGLGMLAKGPALLISVIPAIMLMCVLTRNRKRIRSVSHLIGGLVFLLIAVPWFVVVYLRVPHAMDLWFYESLGEFGENVEKARPWWLYLAAAFQLSLPWTPMWIAGWASALGPRPRGWMSPRRRRRLIAVGWFVIVVAIFSLAHVKKNAYLLPVMPAQTLITADAIATLLMLARRRVLREWTQILAAMQAAIAVGFAGWFIVTFLKDASLAFAIIAMLASLIAVVPIVRKRFDLWLMSQTIAYSLLLILMIGVYRSERDNRRSPREFAEATARYAEQTRAPIAVHALPEEAAFYMPLGMRNEPDASRVLVVVDHSPKDAPVSAELLSDLLRGAMIRNFERIALPLDDGRGRWQLYDVVIYRDRA